MGGDVTREVVNHPAKFNNALISEMAGQLEWHARRGPTPASLKGDRGVERKFFRVVDPFAGVGKIGDVVETFEAFAATRRAEGHDMSFDAARAIGIELEPEWAQQAPANVAMWEGDCVQVMREFVRDGMECEAIVTSPTYGNRMADHHVARDDSKRMTYTHQLGRKLSDGNSGAMQWGVGYRNLHRRAWGAAVELLRDDGLFVLNCKNHIRGGEVVDVTAWHVEQLEMLGLNVIEHVQVPVSGMGFGQNREVRVEFESVVVLRK